MQSKKGALSFVLALLLIFSLTGCSSAKFNPTETSIYIKKDRSIISAEIEEFDNSEFDEERYDEDELREFVEEAVIAYNTEKDGLAYAYESDTKEDLAVSIDSLTVEDGIATLILNYASSDDYVDFYGSAALGGLDQLIVGLVSDGVNSDLSFTDMLDADGNEADYDEVTENESYVLVAVQGSVVMQVQGTVMYYSSGCTLQDSSTVVTTDEICYVIFK